jgi:uncharacterized protein YjbJ (UPF0337 family)
MGSRADKIKGPANEAIDKVSRGVGKIADNPKLVIEGNILEASGDAQKAVGETKETDEEGSVGNAAQDTAPNIGGLTPDNRRGDGQPRKWRLILAPKQQIDNGGADGVTECRRRSSSIKRRQPSGPLLASVAEITLKYNRSALDGQ